MNWVELPSQWNKWSALIHLSPHKVNNYYYLWWIKWHYGGLGKCYNVNVDVGRLEQTDK